MGKVNKLYSDDPHPYNETINFKILSCGNILGNNNKFYAIEIQKNKEGKYRVFTHYGRTGISNIYEERGPYSSIYEAEREFDSIIKKKLRGKTIKNKDGSSYREQYEIVETLSPTVGSLNIKGKVTPIIKTGTGAEEVVKAASQKFTPTVTNLIQQLAQENIHHITSVTGNSILLTDRGLETALGPVTLESIHEAQAALNTLKLNMVNGAIDPTITDVVTANNFYFSKIPHYFKGKVQPIVSDTKLIEEYDLLEQLKTAVTVGMNNSSIDNTSTLFKLDTDIELLDKEHPDVVNLIKEVEGTKKHGNLSKWKVLRIFKVRISDERNRFDDSIGNTQKYFHGSQNSNLLSILLGGLIIPPVNSPTVTGRMFGDGIYGASSSTKSLNYSVGYWSHRRNKYNNAFLLRVKFAMGRTYKTGRALYSGAPTGYDSISALSSMGSLYNDEYIVYKVDRCTITHLIELI